MRGLRVSSKGYLVFEGKEYRVALGAGGVTANKREGDLATPKGCFPIRYVFYRPDRINGIETSVALKPLTPDDGWCDDPQDPNYNKNIKLPYPASAERLWREDSIYDIVVVLGYNDDPVIPGKGSAIFLHVARENYSPTAGCVAVAQDELLEILKKLNVGEVICVE